MTLRRSVPASDLADERVSGWPRGSAPGVPACCFSAATSLRVLSPDRLGGSGDIEVLRCLSASKRAGRINAWRSSDKLNHLRKLGSAEVSRDLLNASLMEQ